MEERVRVCNTISLVVHSSVGAAALLEAVALRPFFNQSRLIAGQSQLVDLGIGGVPDAGEQTKGRSSGSACRSVNASLSRPRFSLQAVQII